MLLDGVKWLFLTGDQITFLVVHLGGFILDLTVGFFMILKSTRPYAFFFCAMFNLMNSRMFAIGMFPYVMIAVMPIFCDADWPKKYLAKIPKLQSILGYDGQPQINPSCIYSEGEMAEAAKSSNPSKRKKQSSSVNLRHRLTTILLCCYFILQGFLPYSHWVTKGYNTWTQGLYGYSWDMMVHNWRYVHTTITVVEKKTGKTFHLDPDFWTDSHRWTHHADMVKQLAHCVQQEMNMKHNLTDIAVYIDVWTSLNKRFTQRMYDPTVDILTAQWSPYEEVSWVLPLQSELTEWRKKLIELEEGLFSQSENIDVVFIADFPGFSLVNYIGEDFENTSLHVLKGVVEVEMPPDHAVKLTEGQRLEIPVGQYHRVSPLKHKPACYMYIYYMKNKTNLAIGDADQDFWHAATCPADYTGDQVEKNATDMCDLFCWQKWKKDFLKKLRIWTKSMSLIGQALFSIVTQNPMNIDKKVQLKEF